MSSRKLIFDDENKQYVALYTNIKGEVIEKRFKRQTADKTHAEIIQYWRSVDALSIREKIKINKTSRIYGRNKKRVMTEKLKKG